MAWTYGDSPVEALRVSFRGPLNDPERPTGVNQGLHEFPAVAAFDENDKLIQGRRALVMDIQFPLKAILLLRSGVRRPSAFRGLPDTDVLLAAKKAKKITDDDMENILLEHFRFMLNQAMLTIKNRRFRPTRVGVGYPNYLCNKEVDKDFDKYMPYLELLVQRVVDELNLGVEVRRACEAQAGSLYLCDLDFNDGLSTARRDIWTNVLQGVDRKEVTLAMYDLGSSSLVSPFQCTSLTALC